MRRRLLGTLVLAAVLTAWATATPQAVAQDGDSTGTFSGTAVADAVRVNVSIPNYLLIQDFVDGGGPSAQAVLDSLGVSRAFASFPYPGELGVSATGLVSTLTGFSLPSYPLIANSDYPVQPERNVDQPGLHLDTKSDPGSSVGDARFGETTGDTLEGGGFARASVTSDDQGRVTARAEARFSVAVGPVQVRGVRSVAQVVRSADGKVTPTSSLEVGTISIAGIDLSLTDRGLVLAGTPLVPIDVINGVAQGLSISGTTIKFLPATTTGDSVTSAGLEITTSQDLPAVGHPLNVSFRLGNVMARAANSAFGADVVATPPLSAVDGSGGSVLPDLGGGSGLPAFETPALGTPAATSGGATVTVPVVERRLEGDRVRISTWTFFPVLVLAGAALLMGALGDRWRHARDLRT
jgi:hypothetical protein